MSRWLYRYTEVILYKSTLYSRTYVLVGVTFLEVSYCTTSIRAEFTSPVKTTPSVCKKL